RRGLCALAFPDSSAALAGTVAKRMDRGAAAGSAAGGTMGEAVGDAPGQGDRVKVLPGDPGIA
ncbi:MAG: hypothetical protein ACK5UT_27430, partial [Acidobacteriota bacterium]